MKIILFITGLGMGGAENLVINLADSYFEAGHEVKIIYAFKNQVVFTRNTGIEVISLNVNHYWDFLGACYRFQKIIRKFKPDVIHSHMYHANILARLSRPFYKVNRLISTAHSINEGGKLRMLFYRATDLFADVTTNVSQEAVDSFIMKGAVKRNKIKVVENGIDTNKFVFSSDARLNYRRNLQVNSHHKVILAIGSLREAKDYPNLLHAIKSIHVKRDDIQLKIIGHGPLLSELKQLVSELQLDEVVEFLGVSFNIPEYLSSCDCFVLSSCYEGFGLVVAEAMSCERPVVATDCGGVREVIGESGFLVRKQDNAQLAKAIENVLNMSDIGLKEMTVNSRSRVIEKFSLDLTASKYLKLYKVNN
ncbi:glycosyltransferase [Vibrio crassostreae]|uniref:glycosyltransferase n=1 Tax=Vibrio crassostreae TaxID=246167 RepID=UPI001B301A9B|nr:glycosyltransferase [Vibrio crassostreae]